MPSDEDREFMTHFMQWRWPKNCDLFATYERVARACDRYEHERSGGTNEVWVDLGGEG